MPSFFEEQAKRTLSLEDLSDQEIPSVRISDMRPKPIALSERARPILPSKQGYRWVAPRARSLRVPIAKRSISGEANDWDFARSYLLSGGDRSGSFSLCWTSPAPEAEP